MIRMPHPRPRMTGPRLRTHIAGLALLFMAGCGPSFVYPVAAVETHSLSLVVTDPAATVDTVSDLAVSMDGQIDAMSVQFNAFSYLGVVADQGSISLRVPPDRLKEALDRIKSAATDVTYCRVDRQEVALKYEQLQVSVQDMEAAEAELLQTMELSLTLHVALTAYSQLFEVQEALYTARSRMAHLEEDTSMIFLAVDLLPAEVGPIEAPGPCTDLPSP